MVGPDDKKDELLNRRPLAPAEPAAVTTELNLADPALRPLTERFELLGELGRGGMGIVYRARDRETGAVVALKILRPDIAADTAVIERFKSELLLARKITHKNVCRIYDLHRFGPTAAIAMEYVEGESLRAFLQRFGDVPLRRGQEWARQICSALAEAHTQGVVHRDLKPENILIDRQGQAKVMDFGIARSLETTSTQTATVLGTPAYMSPEQAQGKPADARSDIYSLGLILYEMFAGRPAFRADTPVAFALKQIHETPPPPREVEPDLPARIDRAIHKCLEKNPKKRFQSALELEAALSEKAEMKPAAAGEEVELPLHLTHWQRSDWLLVAAAVAGLALFFPFFNRTSLAPRSQVHFDRSVLRRIAQDYAQRLGAPVDGEGRIEIGEGEVFQEAYDFVAERAGALAALELCDNPVPYWLWYVAWDNGTHVWVDNRGSLSGFYRDFPASATPERLSVDVARPLAEKALKDHFGREASEMVLETAADDTWEQHPAVKFRWADRNDFQGLKRRYEVRLVGRDIANLDRNYSLPAGYAGKDIMAVWQVLPWLGLVLILVVLGYSQRHLVDLGARWRVATAALICVGGMWFVWQLPTPLFAKIFLSSTVGFAVGLLIFFVSIPVELSVRRMAQAKLVSLGRLFTLTAASEPCGLAIVRGTSVGLALLGADTFLVWLVTSHSSRSAGWLDSFQHIGLQAHGFLRSPWSSAHILYAMLQILPSAILAALFTSFMARLVRRPWLAVLLAAALSVLFLPAPFSYMGAVQPYHWKALLLFFDFLVLAWTFSRFDVLTLAWAALTFAFCWENYHLLVMLTSAGVLEPWIDFVVFGLFVVAAAGVAFKSSLRQAYRRLATAFE